MAKQTYQRATSPRGVLVYPHLVEPDTKFVKPDGEYHTKLALDEDAPSTIAFIKTLDTILTEYRDAVIAEEENPKKRKLLEKSNQADVFEDEMDDEGQLTGRVIFKFKLKAKVVTKTKSWDQKPRLFDGNAKPIQSDVNPWTGSEAKIQAEIFPYYMESTKTFGLSLRCVAVQLLKLVQGSGASADEFGFGVEEDAYVDPDAAPAGFTPEADDDEDGENSEF